tara:strand:- start:7092 stop:7826 length:735 start_codon:yes stop_codon:yes gene_type:complete
MCDDDLSIYPVKPLKIDKKKRLIHPNLPDINIGSLLLLISPIRTGKSSIIVNLLLNPNFYRDKFDIVYIISNTIHNDTTSRFLKEAFPETIFDEYSDEIINNIINYQKSFPKEKQPLICIVLDDYLGIKGGSMIYHLASRARHYNVGLLIFSSQLFRGLPPVLRQNCTHAIIGSPNPSQLEIDKIADEFGTLYEGSENFKKLYHEAGQNRYDFLYLDLHNNPSKAYRNFTELIYKGKENGESQV